MLTSKFVWLAVAICVVGYVVYIWLDSIGGAEVFRQRYGRVAPLVSVPLTVIACVSPFPSDIIAIANGTLFGFVWGSFWTWLAWWIAAWFQYLLGRQMRVDFDLQAQTARLPAWLRRFPVGHPVYLIFSRQIPWAGGHVSTLVPAAAGVPFGRYFWCSALACVPGAVLYGAMGAKLLNW